MKDNRKHSAGKQTVRQGLCPEDPRTGLSGLAKHRSGLSTNRSAVAPTHFEGGTQVGANPGNAARITGKQDI
jgi:hypothetical protein